MHTIASCICAASAASRSVQLDNDKKSKAIPVKTERSSRNA
jgi:hypothetical protein